MAPSGLKAVVRKSECGAGGSECRAGRGQGLVGCGSGGAGPSWGALGGALLGVSHPWGGLGVSRSRELPPACLSYTRKGRRLSAPPPRAAPSHRSCTLGGVIVVISFHQDDSHQGRCKDILCTRRNFPGLE